MRSGDAAAAGARGDARPERRRTPRRTPHPDEPLTQMRMRTGRELRVVDVADAGALVEGEARLLPGTRLEVHVVTHEGRVLVRSRVTRAFVCEVHPGSVRYRGALAFEAAVSTAAPGYALPGAERGRRAEQGSAYPAGSGVKSAKAEERPLS
jgi:hypothetical protein